MISMPKKSDSRLRNMPANAVAAVPTDGSAAESQGVRIRGVSKVYAARSGAVDALRSIDLEVKEGEFVAIVGPSGCGKSTLLHIVAGLIEMSCGRVDVHGLPARAGRSDIGIMLQRAVLLPWRTVIANVLMPAVIQRRDATESRHRAEELLQMMDIAEFADKHVWELSGGMRQRASLAQALVTDPAVLLMDEPFSAVDEFTRERLNIEVARLHAARGRTTLYVTHNIQEAVFLADRVVVMRPRPGEIEEIVTIDLPHPRTAEVLDLPHTSNLTSNIRRLIGKYV
jgi:NitT/TauT family transport system ATP-binding protein